MVPRNPDCFQVFTEYFCRFSPAPPGWQKSERNGQTAGLRKTASGPSVMPIDL
jgi:hypothetical protein